jgi:Kef-type K+ transport system membrane component KefB
MALGLDCVLLVAATVLLARAASALRLPPLLGMIFAGALLGFLDLPAALPGPRLEGFSGPLRLAVLAVVLLRAGLGMSISDLRSSGSLGLRLGSVPMLADAVAVCAAGMWLLDLDAASALVLGFLVAAISPAIVIPGLIDLLERKPSSNRALGALLVGAPLDNILALVLMGAALDAAMLSSGPSTALVAELAWSVGAGLVAGVAAGSLLGRAVGRRGLNCPGRVVLLLLGAIAGLLVWAGESFHFSFVLALIALGSSLRRIAPELCEDLGAHLRRIWDIAQYLLFGLIGSALDMEPVAAAGLALVAVVVLGQAGRLAGSLAATAGSGLSARERLACALAYVPKATIQAAFAALPLDRVLAAGDAAQLSRSDAELILCAGVLAVVITAPVGAVTLNRGVDRLLAPPPV